MSITISPRRPENRAPQKRIWILGAVSALLLSMLACTERHADVPKPNHSAPSVNASSEPSPQPAEPIPTEPATPEPIPSEPAAVTPAADPFGADLDPANDQIVAPPDAIPNCADELTRAGVTFRVAALPLKQNQAGTFTCGAHDAVLYQKGPTGLSISPPALMTCRMALALVRLETLMQELATQELGTSIRRVHQMGTYSCRKMVRFDFVSEHSYGNAIDIGSFTLSDGRRVSVAQHFGKLDAAPPDARARFLRTLGNAAFDRNLVSVSLGPHWDSLHRDHFHFDMARYRVDGSR